MLPCLKQVAVFLLDIRDSFNQSLIVVVNAASSTMSQVKCCHHIIINVSDKLVLVNNVTIDHIKHKAHRIRRMMPTDNVHFKGPDVVNIIIIINVAMSQVVIQSKSS
jgi:hypothetical protein